MDVSETPPPSKDHPENRRDPDFERILELVRLAAAQSGGCAECIVEHRGNLIALGETEARLNGLPHWRQYSLFTAREKAALGLSESLSLTKPRDFSQMAFWDAHRCFSPSELVHLTVAILTVNDWMDLHPILPTRVLVVEDNPDDEFLLRRQLQKAHMEENVLFISNGLKAFEMLTGPEGVSFRQNLIAAILDIHLPGMNGVELLRRIRELPGMEEFPVVMLSATTDPKDIEACKRLNVATFVEKPVTYSSFSKAIATLFHRSQES